MAILICSEQFFKSKDLGINIIVAKYGELNEIKNNPSKQERIFYVNVPYLNEDEIFTPYFIDNNGEIVMIEDQEPK